MTPECAQELLDLIMLDETVARRKALDRWTRRWVTTVEATTQIEKYAYMEVLGRQRAALLRRLCNELVENTDGHAFVVGKPEGKVNELMARISFIRQEPLEVM